MAVISTNEARCKDCYKCLRYCPVKAIRFVGGPSKSDLHASIMQERCILDGTCLLACPQSAKKVRPETRRAVELIESGRTVIASVAPSFAGVFVRERQGRVVTALKELGFSRVEETAWAAEAVARGHLPALETVDRPLITSACPAVVNLVEMYYPEALPHLAPVVSPMVAHARLLKARYPGCAVVFVGPCIAKKDEGEKSGDVDAVITFSELSGWLRESHIDMEALEETDLDGPRAALASVFPLDGGLLRTAGLPTDVLSEEFQTVSGVEHCIEFLEGFKEGGTPARPIKGVEMMACRGGCIAGPGIHGCSPLVPLSGRRQAVLDYARRGRARGVEPCPPVPGVSLERAYHQRRPHDPEPSEAAIRSILEQTGKHSVEDEYNCGACGYGSCREKAVAVFRGLADIQMCIPFMRERAESLSNMVLSSTPNAVLVVDANLCVLDVNNAAESMFACTRQQVVGRPVSDILDPTYFRRALESRKLLKARVEYPRYSVVTEQAIFYVEKENAVVGVFVDKTEEERHRADALRTRKSVVSRAQQVIDKQMSVAQEIAGLLGETTAETKVLLTKLIELMQKDE